MARNEEYRISLSVEFADDKTIWRHVYIPARAWSADRLEAEAMILARAVMADLPGSLVKEHAPDG